MATMCCWPSRPKTSPPSKSISAASSSLFLKMTKTTIMSSNWSATVLTLFPEMFPGPLGHSLLGKALDKQLWSLDVRDIRDHGLGKHRTVDDTPAGGGPGMVMRADVAAAAIDAVDRAQRPLIYLSPRGAPLTQARVQALAAGPGVIL